MVATLVFIDNHHSIYTISHTKIMLFYQITAIFTNKDLLTLRKKIGELCRLSYLNIAGVVYLMLLLKNSIITRQESNESVAQL